MGDNWPMLPILYKEHCWTASTSEFSNQDKNSGLVKNNLTFTFCHKCTCKCLPGRMAELHSFCTSTVHWIYAFQLLCFPKWKILVKLNCWMLPKFAMYCNTVLVWELSSDYTFQLYKQVFIFIHVNTDWKSVVTVTFLAQFWCLNKHCYATLFDGALLWIAGSQTNVNRVIIILIQILPCAVPSNKISKWKRITGSTVTSGVVYAYRTKGFLQSACQGIKGTTGGY